MRSCFVLALAVFTTAVWSHPGGHGGPGGFLPFLRTATEEQKQSFKQLMESSAGLTKQDLESAVDAWATQQGGDIKTAYDEFKAKVASLITEMQAKIASSTLSAETKAALQQLADIKTNKALTIADDHTQSMAVIQALTAEQKAEVKQFARDNFPQMMGPPHHHGGPHPEGSSSEETL